MINFDDDNDGFSPSGLKNVERYIDDVKCTKNIERK